jgi:predicted metal-dependent HD superfamily phosphohydrolase
MRTDLELEHTKSSLRNRWEASCAQLSILALSPKSLAAPSDLGDELIKRYSESHRVFHTTAHLLCVLEALDALSSDPLLQLAAWFHDAIYQPGMPWNERRSARLANVRLARLGVPQIERNMVAEAVLATRSHDADEPRYAALLDADLSVLGASDMQYQSYCAAIRAEYAFIPLGAFLRGRLRFIEGMLAREAIYHTAPARSKFEDQARGNLERELHHLRERV